MIRICVMGNSGSGKSVLADVLGKKLGIQVFHLDRELLFGNFERHRIEKQVIIHDRLIAKDNWIIDGDYRSLVPARLERATLVIFLQTPRLFTLGRIIRRYLTNNHLRKSIPKDARNVLTWKYVWWVLKHSSRKRLRELKNMVQLYPKLPLLVLGRGSSTEMANRVIIELDSRHTQLTRLN